MRKNLQTLFCALCALSFIPSSVMAEVLLNEHFNQATGTLATNVDASSIGTDWTNITGSGDIYMNDADLTYSGYKSSSDDTKSIEYKATYGKKVAKSFTSKNSGSLYAAAIVKVSSCGASSNGNSRNYLWTFCNVTSSNVGTAGYHYGRLCIQKTDSKFKFGISKQSELSPYLAYTEELEYNTPYLVVLEYKFVSGSNNDIVYLYVNPTKGDKPEATLECHQVALNPNNNNVDVGSGTKADPSSLVSFVFNNTSSGTSGSKWNCLIDELKVVTDWADLWEAGDEPGGDEPGGGDDPEPEVVPAPSPASSGVTAGSATISWGTITGADSYMLQWKANGGSYSSDIAIDKDVRSYSMSGLSANTQYYVRVKTIKGESASDFAEINFTTLLPSLAPEASNITVSSAKISWPAISGITVDSYVLQWKEGDGSWSEEINNGTSRIYNMSGLNSETTFSVRVKAKKGTNYSEWAEISFTTNAYTEPIVYKGVTFDKWESMSALPTSGEYYLANNVERTTDVTLSGDLKLCLNGRTFLTLARIIIPEGVTLTIYDNLGGGSISGYYECDAFPLSGLIHIEDGGTLILHEGAVQNLNVDPNDGSLAYAIYNQGNLHIAGNPVISAATADIRLFSGKVITLDGELTNTTKYSVNPAGQTITSGWSTYMSGEDPYMYFVSAKSGYKGIILSEGEVRFVPLSDLDLNLSESSEDNESKLTAQLNENASLAITRSPLTNAQYNTICLPYSMDDDEMQLRFGEDYDLEEFVSSSIDGDVLNLTFNPVTTLVAGKPYLLKPSIDAPVLAYASVNIAAASPVDNTSDANISFHGTFNPTELEGGNRNLLFLGAGNELFWPESTGNIKGFRAYFEVKGGAQGAKRARIVKKEEGATGVEPISDERLTISGKKILRNGQLLILRDNKTYNVLGMEYK